MLLRVGFLGMIILMLGSCQGSSNLDELVIEISNTSELPKSDIVLEINDKNFIEKLNKLNTEKISVHNGSELLAFQLVCDSESVKSLLINLDMPANKSISLVVQEDENAFTDFPKRTQAEISVKEEGDWQAVVKKNGNEQFEYIGGDFKNINYLRVPDEHTDHTFYIRYEGPGWESDKVAYRYYLDWRNAVDIFGKRTTDMVLQGVGLDGFDSYHEYSEWGMDVLKVGKSLGLGSIAYWDGTKAMRVANTDSITCNISQNGNLRSEITTNYYGWKDSGKPTDLSSVISINAGSRLTKQSLYTTSELQNICTGIVKHGVDFIQSEGTGGKWSYIATYGKQSLNDDNLGMVVFYNTDALIKLTEDEHSIVLVLKPNSNSIEYYYGAVWEKDVDSIRSKEQFLEYLQLTLNNFNNPVKTIYN